MSNLKCSTQGGDGMETCNIVIGIVASALSILATILSVSNYRNIKIIQKNSHNNNAEIEGNGNNQINGSNNWVN